MKTRVLLVISAITAIIVSSPAEARHRPHHQAAPHHHFRHSDPIASKTGEILNCDNTGRCTTFGEPQGSPYSGFKVSRRARVAGSSETIIGGRPAGCPHAFCGCGARIYLGLSDIRLNLAWNWTKYYHGGTPVAVWPHHIAIIEHMTGPHMAILRDYNSGNGLSRIHERSIAGARIIGAAYSSL